MQEEPFVCFAWCHDLAVSPCRVLGAARGTTKGATLPEDPLHRRLVQQLPKLLLEQGGSRVGMTSEGWGRVRICTACSMFCLTRSEWPTLWHGFQQQGTPSAAGLELLLWAPQAPAAGKKDVAAALAAVRRYAEKFAELVAAGTPVTGLQSQESLLQHSWQQFLKRWLAAARAAAKAEVRFVVFVHRFSLLQRWGLLLGGRAIKTAL